MLIRRVAAKLAALLLLTLGAAGPLFAASSATITIDVQIVGTLSVSVDGGGSSTGTAVTWNTAVPNQMFVSQASATVTNDSGGLTEKWALSSDATSINTQGNAETWTLSGSTSPALPGADHYALQAVFGSTNTLAGGCPAVGAADWNNDYAKPLTATPVTYTSTVFTDPNLAIGGAPAAPDTASGPHDGRMQAGHKRALCWRLIAPGSSSTVDTQNIQIVITAQSP